jgi:Flp pilus assembly protein TadB
LQDPNDGGIEDSSLTASQLRARYGIQGRTHDNNSDSGMSSTMVAVLVVACGLLAVMVVVLVAGTGVLRAQEWLLAS